MTEKKKSLSFMNAEELEMLNQQNNLLDRMKNAIINNKGIRLSAEEMQIIGRMNISQVIMGERTEDTPEID